MTLAVVMRMCSPLPSPAATAATAGPEQADLAHTEHATCNLYPKPTHNPHPTAGVQQPSSATPLADRCEMVEGSRSQQAASHALSSIADDSCIKGCSLEQDGQSAGATPAASAEMHDTRGPAAFSLAEHFRHEHPCSLLADQHGQAQQSHLMASAACLGKQHLSRSAASDNGYAFDAALLGMPAEQLGRSKQEMRRRLAFLSSCYPIARPSQGMLKQVHY